MYPSCTGACQLTSHDLTDLIDYAISIGIYVFVFNQVQSKLGMYMKNTLKSKSSLVALVDKLKPLGAEDSACKQPPGCT